MIRRYPNGGTQCRDALLTNVQLSARNLAKVKAVPVNGLNVEDAVNYDKLILTQDAVKKIEEVLA